MSTLAERIYEAIKLSGLSYGELSHLTEIPKSALQRYAIGETTKCPLPRIEAIAKATGVPAAYILGWEEKPATDTPCVEKISFRSVPLLGEIACGEPILAQENVDGDVNVDSEVACDFALRCRGDSMAPRLLDGDLVFIKQQPSVDNGQIAAVLIGTEATLKHVYVQPTSIQLVAENPAYAPIILTGEDAQNARILGKAVAYRRCL